MNCAIPQREHAHVTRSRLGDADQLTELLELGSPEYLLLRDVRELPLGAHERQAHHPTLHALPKKMEFCINMLRAIVYRIGF
jgi:hypothetical protein